MPNDQTREAEGFIRLPNYVFDDPKLTANEKLVLIGLYRYAYGDRRTAFPSQVTLAASIRAKPQTVRRSLTALQAKGYIRPIGERKRNVVEYEILALPSPHFAMSDDPQPSPETATSPSPQMARSSPRSSPHLATNKTNQKDKRNKTARHQSTCSPENTRVEPDTVDEDNDPPTGGQEESRGREEFGRLQTALAHETQAFGLDVEIVPDTLEWAKAEIERAIREAGGDNLNRKGSGSLDGLIERFGIERCWREAHLLSERIAAYSECVKDATRFYVTSLENNFPRPAPPTREKQVEKFARGFLDGAVKHEQFPPHLWRDIWDMVDTLNPQELPF